MLYFHTLQFAFGFDEKVSDAEHEIYRPTFGLIRETFFNTVVPRFRRFSKRFDDIFRFRSFRYIEVITVVCKR